MTIQRLQQRIRSESPGWPEWRDLVELVESLDFKLVETDYLGNFAASDERLVFSLREQDWPEWLPSYVSALHGMKCSDWEAEGGYADAFENLPVEKGFIMDPSGFVGDEALGYPVLELPPDLYPFQANQSGTRFFIKPSLEVVYFDSASEELKTFDTLEQFTIQNIRMALENRSWYEAYQHLEGLHDL